MLIPSKSFVVDDVDGENRLPLEKSPIILSASLQALCNRSISSRFCAASPLSYINLLGSPELYKCAMRSSPRNAFVLFIINNMMVLGTISRHVLVTIFM